MSQREIAAAAAKKYILSHTNTSASAPADRNHSVITPITLGKADEGENTNREDFLQAILTEFFLEYPVLVVPDAITDPQPVIVTVLDNVILTKLVCYHNSLAIQQYCRMPWWSANDWTKANGRDVLGYIAAMATAKATYTRRVILTLTTKETEAVQQLGVRPPAR
eukprot:g360.t1